MERLEPIKSSASAGLIVTFQLTREQQVSLSEILLQRLQDDQTLQYLWMQSVSTVMIT